MDPDIEKTLFERIAQSDQDAYTRIFHLYTPRLYPYILKLTKNDQLAKEFLQETFLRLWANREQLPGIALPGSWLFRVAANICLSYLRIEAGRSGLQQQVYNKMRPAAFSVTEEVDYRQVRLVIHKAIELLPEKRKQVYLLSREDGLSHKEIAERLDISVHTVKNHLALALRFIQDYLREKAGILLQVPAIFLFRIFFEKH